MDLTEFLNCIAIKEEAVHRSGSEWNVYSHELRGVALAIALQTGEGYIQIMTRARNRARHIFNSAQDWRREIQLYNSYYEQARQDRLARS